MSRERFQRLERLFMEALELAPPERAAFLDARCTDDPALRREVDELLAQDSADSPLSLPIYTPIEDSPQQIGPYRVLARIGEGGFGIIYLAEQLRPIQRQVAIKVLKAGMDSKAVLSRFEIERQALARIDHPNVARVLDAGVTDRGRPYFVMEYVNGLPITDYCDRERLDLRARMALMIPVCQAVQHAHQKGIIHRDLKPSNILIATADGKPVPKVIDFGIAKATATEMAVGTAITRFGQVIGTPEYMSPEQAASGGIDVDTRTDVYSLGVTLHFLLTGILPFDAVSPGRSAAAGRTHAPPEAPSVRPSRRVTTANVDPDVARQRRVDTNRELARVLNGDPDWIIMKAMEHDRGRRYQAISELSDDIGRFLRDEPVSAGPPSLGYRARKYARRHRIAFAIGAAVLVGILGVTAGVTIALIESNRQRALSEAARQKAEEARGEAETVTDFLARMLTAVDPDHLGRDVTVRQVLEGAAGSIDETFMQQPKLASRLLYEIGWTYRGLGETQRADSLLERSMRERSSLFGPESREAYQPMALLAEVAFDLGRFAEAESLHLRAYRGRRALLGANHDETIGSMLGLASFYSSMGRFAEAEPLHREAVRLCRRAYGEHAEKTLSALNNLAIHMEDVGRYPVAESLHRAVLEVRERQNGDSSTIVAATLNNLASHLLRQNRPDEAKPLLERSLNIRRARLGEEHGLTSETRANLAAANTLTGQLMTADSLLTTVLRIWERELGPEHTYTLTVKNNLCDLYRRQGHLKQAETMARSVVEARRRVLGADNPGTRTAELNLAQIWEDAGRYSEASRMATSVLEARRRILGVDHPQTLHTETMLARIFRKSHRLDEALSFALHAAEGTEQASGRSENRSAAISELCSIYAARGDRKSEALWRARLTSPPTP